MGSRARRADPDLWESVKEQVTRSGKRGRPGQWSARKAQLAVQEYKRRGGRYVGAKRADNSLVQWIRQDWGTASGRRSLETGERYLPRAAREALTADEYEATTLEKRRDAAAGRQFSRQPASIAKKVAPYRRPAKGTADPRAPTRDDLYREARRQGIAGASRLRKSELERALARAKPRA